MRRRALVTGAGRGIGRASALALAAVGYDATLVARTRSELEDTANEVAALGQLAEIEVGDVTNPEVLPAAFARAPVSVLVNAAGANHPEPFIDVSLETFDGMMALNLRATFAACQVAARRWLEKGARGVIVNLTSQMGHVGAVNRSAYCASKHAVEGLTKALAVELGPHGIRVVSVAPTFVSTPMTAKALSNPKQRAEVLAQIPLGLIGTAEDVAQAVVFAASDEARLMNGSSLVIDGGWTAQ